MKRIISSGLVTLSLLSGLSGALVTVNADSTPSDKMQTVQLNNKVSDLSGFNFTKIGLYNNYILSTPLADGVVGNNLTNDSTKIEFSSLASDVVSVGVSKSLSNDSSLAENKVVDGKADLDISNVKDIQNNSNMIYVKTAGDPDTIIPVAMLTRDTFNDEYNDFSHNKMDYSNRFTYDDTMKANYTKNGKITNKTTKLTFKSKALPKILAATHWYISEFDGDEEIISTPMIKDDKEHEVTIEVPEGYFTPNTEYNDKYTLFANNDDFTSVAQGIISIDKSQIEIVK